MDAFVLMCPLSLCILRVFALSEYLCTPSERRTRNLAYFLNSLTACRKGFFDKLKHPHGCFFLCTYCVFFVFLSSLIIPIIIEPRLKTSQRIAPTEKFAIL